MTNRADLDQLASLEATDLDLQCLRRQGMSCSAREGLKTGTLPLSSVQCFACWVFASADDIFFFKIFGFCISCKFKYQTLFTKNIR